MVAGVNRRRCGWIAAGLLAVLGSQAWSAVLAPADFTGDTQAAVRFEFSADTPETAYLVRSFPPELKPPCRFGVAYHQPIVVRLNYAPGQAGPDGFLNLPENRRWNADLAFSLFVGERNRPLIPDGSATRLTLFSYPGKFVEEWVWPDGLHLLRTVFQSSTHPGVGIRFTVTNQTGRSMNGFRIHARIADPEIFGVGGGRSSADEMDDDIFSDPRSGLLYQRDGQMRDESWLAIGWSPAGGPITAGEDAYTQRSEPNADMLISLETPAVDLEPGQSQTAVFWFVWAYEQNTAMASLEALRQYSGYSAWDQKVKRSLTRGARFRCRDPYLTHLFQIIKAWAAWLEREDSFGQASLQNIANLTAVEPEQVCSGVSGLMVFGLAPVLRKHLDHWLDQRLETPDGAYTVLNASAYYRLSGDWPWLKENAARILDLLDYLRDLDRTQDGQPEYNYLSGSSQGSRSRFVFQQHPGVQSTIQFSLPALATVAAFRSGADLLARSGDPEIQAQAGVFRGLAQKAEKSLFDLFWNSHSGRSGFLIHARTDHGKIFAGHDAGSIDSLRYGIGQVEIQQSIFQDLWSRPEWLTPQGVYKETMNSSGEYATAPATDFSRTHAILTQGLRDSRTADEALRRLQHYAQRLLLNPQRLGIPGGEVRDPMTGLEVPCLNYAETIAVGLCGLEPVAEGLRVHVPAYTDDLDAQINRWPCQGGWVEAHVTGSGGRGGKIWVNGRLLPDGGLIPTASLAKTTIKIEIRRFVKK